MLKEDKSNAFEVDASDLLKTGLFPERFERKIPMWDDSDGFQFTEFGMRVKETYGPLLYDMGSEPIRGITTLREFGTKVIYSGDLSTIDSFRLDTQANDTVGTGYTLYENAVGGSTWDTSGTVIETGTHKTVDTDAPDILYPFLPSDLNLWAANALVGMTANNTTDGSSGTITVNAPGSATMTLSGGADDSWDVNDAFEIVSNADSAWDSGSSTWDEGVITANRWSFETFGTFVFATNGIDKPQIKKNNVNFNDLHDDQVSGATITTAGSGYAVGDTITFTTSGSGTGLTATVTELNGTAVSAFEITAFGSSFVDGEVLTQNTTSGSGTSFTATVSVPDAPFETVQIFKKQGPHVIAFNYTEADSLGVRSGEYPTSFNWCSADDVDVWIGASTNTAGSLQIREANTEIKCVAQLGNDLAVYTENQMFLVSYVGQPNYFGYRVALELGGIGAASKHSVISNGRLNFGYSKDGFFMTDGTSITRIGRSNGMDDYVRDNIADNEYEQISGYHNSVEYEISWVFPLNGNSISEEIYYNYNTRAWGKRTSTMTSFDDKGVFENPVAGNAAGELYSYGGQSLIGATPIATTKPHDLGSPDRVKELNSIRVGKEGDGEPQLRIGWADEIDDTPTWTETVYIDASFQDYCVRTAGRYLFMEFSSQSDYDNYTITDLVIQGRFEGSR